MQTTLRFDFCEPGTVKTKMILTVGRSVKFICEQLDGTRVYSVSPAAERKLKAQFGGTYTNDNGQAVAL